MKLLRRLWNNFEMIFMVGFFYAIMIMVTLAIVLRLVFNYPLYFSEEVCRYCFLWMVFFSFGYATQTNTHIRVDFLKNKLPEKAITFLDYFNDILGLLVFAWILKVGIEYLDFVSIKKSFALQIPMRIITSILPISSAIVIIRIIERIIKRIRKVPTVKGGDEA